MMRDPAVYDQRVKVGEKHGLFTEKNSQGHCYGKSCCHCCTDLSAQLRTLNRRMKEAEEEQYRAEEDAAALRVELNSLHQQAMHNHSGGFMAIGYSLYQIQVIEKRTV